MVFGLLNSLSRKPAVAHAVPAGSRVYAVGDIHGRADLLTQLHGQIVADAERHAADRYVVVYLGDYVDRGLESRQVVDMLLDEPLAGFESVYLKGNHEDFMLKFMEEVEIGFSWLMNGGNATLYSYGVALSERPDPEERMNQTQRDLIAKVPERHMAFFDSLALSHVEGDYFFVHAGVRPGVPLEAQDEEDLMWIRDGFLESSMRYDKMVVHGHSIEWQPIETHNRIGIDTGAFASGVLTCLVLDGTDRTYLST